LFFGHFVLKQKKNHGFSKIRGCEKKTTGWKMRPWLGRSAGTASGRQAHFWKANRQSEKDWPPSDNQPSQLTYNAPFVLELG
jgi:hypothetical protein